MGIAVMPLLEARLNENGLGPEVTARIKTVLENATAWQSDANEAARMQDYTTKILGITKELTLDLGGKVTMRFMLIPAGGFLMGSPQEETGRAGNESQHQVIISKPFHMGAFEVTQEQYEVVMGKTPSRCKGASLPVSNVSWDDAMEFCRKLSAKTAKQVSLPTEAQWEYACRAGTQTPFNTGETVSSEQVNYNGEYVYGNGKKGERRWKGIPVGSFKPNAFGLCDMHGNVGEWCADWYDMNYYATSPTRNPQGPVPAECHVIRGGDWCETPDRCRSAYRNAAKAAGSFDQTGFRVVVLIDPVKI
jgi:formylglycine-generating enzyme required for sulfatase activity